MLKTNIHKNEPVVSLKLFFLNIGVLAHSPEKNSPISSESYTSLKYFSLIKAQERSSEKIPEITALCKNCFS